MEKYKFKFTSGLYGIRNYVVSTLGEIYYRSGFVATTYISVSRGQNVKVKGSDNFNILYAGICYDSQKNYVSSVDSGGVFTSDFEFTVPNGVSYIRINYRITKINAGLASLVIDNGINLLAEYETHAIWNDDFSIETELETGQQFYRDKINGKLTFLKDDYSYIMQKTFDTPIWLTMYEKVNDEWIWRFDSKFMRTDCTIDQDNKIITVQPTIQDQYNKILQGIEKEVDLLQLSPIIIPIDIQKRPMIQIYRPGDNIVSNYIGGMWWEQKAENPTTDKTTITNKYHFALNVTFAKVSVTAQGGAPIAVNGNYYGEKGNKFDTNYDFVNSSSEYYVRYKRTYEAGQYWNELYLMKGDSALYATTFAGSSGLQQTEYTLSGQSGNVGSVKLNVSFEEFYTRYMTDTKTVGSKNASDIVSDDIVENNRNYRYVIGYGVRCIYISTRFSESETEYGQYAGKYYKPPYVLWNPEFFPVARSYWAEYSYWFTAPIEDKYFERDWRAKYTLNDCYPLYSCIAKLVKQIDPDLEHDGIDDYSQFLYGSNNPVYGSKFYVYLTQKSNLINGAYSEPASKAITTLKQFTDMLRDCFNCYWFIDGNKFRIEHIKYFENGMKYTGIPGTSKDLTLLKNVKTGKPWAYRTSNYTYDKEQMPERYTFEWMDDCTEPFQGMPIEVISNYVNEGKEEKINIGNFSSDVDYMLLNPSNISLDGFVLFCTQIVDRRMILPFVDVTQKGYTKTLQNGIASFAYLQEAFLRYNKPAPTLMINGAVNYASSISKGKKQTITFPLYPDSEISPIENIKTYLGYGNVEKISLNLSTQMIKATLKYPTT